MEFVSEEEIEILSKDSGIEILDAIKGIPFKEKSWIPEDCGVYIITTIDGEPYVGASSSIMSRILHHHIKNIETIDIYLTSDYQKLEKWFIHQIKPSLNVILYNGKTMAILECSENIHNMILKKQLELKEKYGSKPYIRDMVDVAIEAGIDEIEDRLGLSGR